MVLGARNDMKIWNAPVGLLKVDAADAATPRVISVGQAGQGDLQGLWAGRGWRFHPRGVHFEIEVKTGTARLSTAQRKRRKQIQRLGGIYLEARSVEDVVSFFGPDSGGS